MKGYGSYRFQPQVERKPAVLLFYRGQQAVVRFHDGLTHALPAKAFREIEVGPEQRFVLVVTRVGGEVQEIRVEPASVARPRTTPAATPKVVVRQGRKLITRK